MGDRSVGSRSWRLTPEHAPRTQGLVVSAFGHLPCGAALFLTLRDDAGGRWLRALRDVVAITDATGKTGSAAAIAFTCSGLEAMQLDPAAVASFSLPFREGMHQIDRRRRLRDEPDGGTVLEGGPLWGGNNRDCHPADGVESAPATLLTVHAALFLYAADEAALEAQRSVAEEALRSGNVTIARRLRTFLRIREGGVPREHFGFADGISQPVPFGDAIVPRDGPGSAEGRKWHGVPAGEILMGHPNAHHEPAPGPLVSASPLARSMLPADGAPQGFSNLGVNGSYLVVRELRQDVAAFWRSMDRAAASIGDPGVDATWVAERVIGRTREGHPLAPGGALRRPDGEPENDFGFAERDVHGLGCPLGAHVRRANPRDSLPSRDRLHPDLAAAPDLLASANSHRLLRRGRKFGPDVADPRADDGAERGLLFMCLNTDLERQFEFVQQTWLLHDGFATLLDETDPLLGPKGRFTIPMSPLRVRPEVETYVRLAGGEYFFLPSIPALDYLAGLPDPAA